MWFEGVLTSPDRQTRARYVPGFSRVIPNESVVCQRFRGGQSRLASGKRWPPANWHTATPWIPCPGDLDQNGEVDASDLGLLIAAWNTDGSIVEGSDLKGDGIVCAADLGLLIGAWGPCQ